MTKNLSHYKFSAKEIARHKCLDCGVNVIEAGDYCMITRQIWEGQFKLGWNDNLCLACIEKRLGRKLRPMLDVDPAFVEGYPSSDVLLDRFIGEAMIKLVKAARAKGKSVSKIAKENSISIGTVRHCLRDRS